MSDLCPLCQTATTKMRVLFVKHVTANGTNMKAYMDGSLTFESFLDTYRKAMDEES